MLRCVLRDINGRKIAVPELLSLKVDIDEGVPADSLYATFAYAPTEQLTEITVPLRASPDICRPCRDS